MNAPNLASRPFLNTRPVWIVTIAAAVLALLLAAVDVRVYLANKRSLASQLAERRELVERHSSLESEAREAVAELSAIPWSSLDKRVDRLNLILREHSFSWLGMLSDVERVMPYAVRLVRIGPSIGEEEATLSIEGAARSRDAMLEFIDNLIADPSFDHPIPENEKTPEDSSSGEYEFSLVVDYRPDVSAPTAGETP